MTAMFESGHVPQLSRGQRLRVARERANLDQSQLATRIGVSKNTISNAEQDRTHPRQILLNAWALATGVPVSWLEGDDDPLRVKWGEALTVRMARKKLDAAIIGRAISDVFDADVCAEQDVMAILDADDDRDLDPHARTQAWLLITALGEIAPRWGIGDDYAPPQWRESPDTLALLIDARLSELCPQQGSNLRPADYRAGVLHGNSRRPVLALLTSRGESTPHSVSVVRPNVSPVRQNVSTVRLTLIPTGRPPTATSA